MYINLLNQKNKLKNEKELIETTNGIETEMQNEKQKLKYQEL